MSDSAVLSVSAVESQVDNTLRFHLQLTERINGANSCDRRRCGLAVGYLVNHTITLQRSAVELLDFYCSLSVPGHDVLLCKFGVIVVDECKK